jgi:hypothetical protein
MAHILQYHKRSSLPVRLSQDSNICSTNFTDWAGRRYYVVPRGVVAMILGDVIVPLVIFSIAYFLLFTAVRS